MWSSISFSDGKTDLHFGQIHSTLLILCTSWKGLSLEMISCEGISVLEGGGWEGEIDESGIGVLEGGGGEGEIDE